MSRRWIFIVCGAACLAGLMLAAGVDTLRERKRWILGLDASRWARTATELEQVRKQIIARDGPTIVLPVFHAGAAGGLPTDRELFDYGIKLGLLRAPTDEDARLLLGVWREHPSHDARLVALANLPKLVSDGYPFEYERAQVSAEHRAEVIGELVGAIMHPNQANADQERLAAMNACFAGKLWRHEAIWDALTAVRQTAIVTENPVLASTYELMDMVPRGKFEAPP